MRTLSQLREEFGPAALSFFRECLVPGSNRLAQLSEARRAAYYYKGEQHLVPVQARPEIGVSWRPVTSPEVVTGLYAGQDVTIDNYTLNMMTRDVDVVASIMARGQPRAEVGSSGPAHKVSTTVADAIRNVLSVWDYSYNNMDFKLQVARWMVLYPGALFGIVQPVADPGKYGWTDEPVYEEIVTAVPARDNCAECGWMGQGDASQICPQCLAPLDPAFQTPGREEKTVQQTGTKRRPNIGIEFTVRNVLTTFCTPGVKDLTDATWVVDAHYDMPVGRIHERFAKARELVKLEATSSTRTADVSTAAHIQMTINSAQGLTPSYRKGVADVVTHWIDPVEYIRWEGKPFHQDLVNYFPEGVKCTWIENTLVEMVHENFRDAVVMITHDAQPPDATPSRFRPYMDGQTILNELYTQTVRMAATSVPLYLVPSNLIDTNELMTNRHLPNRFLPITAGIARENIIKVEPAAIEPGREGMMMMTIRQMRESVGVTDMILGIGNPDTARAAVINREQSLQIFQAPYQQGMRLYIQAQELYVRMTAKYRMSRIWKPRAAGAPPSAVEVGDLGKVLTTSWRLEMDETVPMTRPDMRAQLRETFQSISTLPPLVEALQFGYPGNAEKLGEFVALAGWTNETLDLTKALMGVYDSIIEAAWPEELIAADPGPVPTPEQKAEWQNLVMRVLAEEPPLVMPNNRNIPLAAVAQIGQILLNRSDRFRTLYRANFPAWIRCDKYNQEAEKQLAQMTPPPGPGGPEAPSAAPLPPGQVPDGQQLMPDLQMNA